MADKKHLWIDDIENAHPDEQEEMTRQPSGGAIIWLFVACAVWMAIIAVMYFGFLA
jgi:hypothetical protein